ncbi:MAG: hypothetical protein NPINA01_30600 [Nitrospinaceae bacterium]|nr:MAG: hypothetical protein NPINA01_30600 [Nitrospinaceae bacterium]
MMDIHAQLEDLKSVAAKLSIEIEICNLGDEELSIQSGLCKIKGNHVLFLDKKLDPESQLEVILKALENFDLETIFVPSWMRERLEKSQPSKNDQ